MNLPDPVYVFLQSQDLPRSVVEAGLPGLVSAWEKTVRNVAEGFQGGLEDYLDAMDTRDLLAEVWEVATEDQQLMIERRLTAADSRMRDLVVPVAQCLYGDLVAEDEGWTAESHWWYFSRPREAGSRLKQELTDGGGPGAGP